jgi:hypothetical protein
MAVASVELWLGGSQAFNGVLRDLPVFYVLHRYTVRKLDLDWDVDLDTRKFIITIEREEGEA